jgi:formylglycine-generating enzyme required for sulfatase activity
VGIFPDGASPYGVLEMSGNVWEWCRSKYENPEDDQIDNSGGSRVLRGGSWGDNANGARAASRLDFTPDFRSDYFGFRLVVVRRPPSYLDL